MLQMLHEILLPALVPGLASTLVLVLAARAWRRDRPAEDGTLPPLHSRGAWTLPLLVPGALALAFWSQERMLPFATEAPRHRWHWVPVAIAAAAAPALVAAFTPRPQTLVRRLVASIVLALLVALPAGLLLELPGLDAPTSRALVAAVAFALVLLTLPPAAVRPGPALPWTLMLAFTALSVMALQANFAKLSLVCAAPSAVAGAMLLAGIPMRRWTVGPGGQAILAATLVILAAAGHAYDYAELGAGLWLLAIAGPAALWLFEVPPFRSRDGLAVTLLRCSVGAAPALAAIGLALLRTMAGDDPSGGGGDDGIYGGLGG